MNEEKIKRINELYRKSKAEGLTDAEKEEQLILRKAYIDAMKRNLRGQLDSITLVDEDGKQTNLGERYRSQDDNKEGN